MTWRVARSWPIVIFLIAACPLFLRVGWALADGGLDPSTADTPVSSQIEMDLGSGVLNATAIPPICKTAFPAQLANVTVLPANLQYLNEQVCQAYSYLEKVYTPGGCSATFDGKDGITSLNYKFAEDLYNMLQAAPYKLTINSGYRDDDAQKCANPNGFGGDPNGSMHTKGLAADLQYPDAVGTSAKGCDTGKTSPAYEWVSKASQANTYGIRLYNQNGHSSYVAGECNHVEISNVANATGGLGQGGAALTPQNPAGSGAGAGAGLGTAAGAQPVAPTTPATTDKNCSSGIALTVGGVQVAPLPSTTTVIIIPTSPRSPNSCSACSWANWPASSPEIFLATPPRKRPLHLLCRRLCRQFLPPLPSTTPRPARFPTCSASSAARAICRKAKAPTRTAAPSGNACRKIPLRPRRPLPPRPIPAPSCRRPRRRLPVLGSKRCLLWTGAARSEF